MYEYKAKVIEVIDGDTVDFDVDLGFKFHAKMRFRLNGIDTPETYGVKKDSEEYKAGMLAKEYVKSRLPVGSEVVITTFKDSTEKYGRYLCTLKVDPNKTLNDEMIEKGFAKPYFGGAK